MRMQGDVTADDGVATVADAATIVMMIVSIVLTIVKSIERDQTWLANRGLGDFFHCTDGMEGFGTAPAFGVVSLRETSG